MSSTGGLSERNKLLIPIAALTSAVLLGLSALFSNLFILTWVAFVPFLFGLNRCKNRKQAYGFGLFSGFVIFALSSYWMAEFIQLFKHYSLIKSIVLASIYWLYCSHLFALIAVFTHYFQRYNAILWVFPTLLALGFAFFPTLFPWQLGNGQSQFLLAVQATDVAGVSGLDFLIGLVNVLIAQAAIGKFKYSKPSAIAAYCLIIMWFGYGAFSLTGWRNDINTWESLNIGLVQANEAPSIETPGPKSGYSLAYPIEMELTENLVAAGAELVIWPELRDKQFYTAPFVRPAFQKQVKQLGKPVLLQSLEKIHTEKKGVIHFNTSVLIQENGEKIDQYRKIKRIAIAEYLPFFDSSDTVKQWVRRYLGDFFGDYSAGNATVKFDVGSVSIKPLICYEALFPGFVASSLYSSGGNILTVQSNNGWFGDTRVPFQHMSASILRSVETRRPLVHVMNNGLGGVVLPTGELLLQTEHREVAGYLATVPYQQNDEFTIYSRFPYWFVMVLLGMLGLIIVRSFRST